MAMSEASGVARTAKYIYIYIYILMGKSRSDFFHRLSTACAETVYCFVQGSRRVTLVQKWMSYFSELEPSHLCHQEHVGAFSKKKTFQQM